MAFIEYNAGKGSLRPGSAKLTKTHLILSADLQDKTDKPNVQVAYDPEIETIRLRPIENGGLKIANGKIQSKGFCKYFGITKRGTFNAKWDDNEKAVFITLKDTGEKNVKAEGK